MKAEHEICDFIVESMEI
jgi:hypothetical protein